MLAGDFESAWRETDQVELLRREQERGGALVWQPHHLLWNGEPFAGRDVLVRCNHGLGDTLQFARFLPLLTSSAKSVTVMAQPSLVRLLSAIPPMGRIVNGWTDPAPGHDVEIEVMELAYAFRVTAENLPREVPYFAHERVRPFGAEIPLPPAEDALKVGLLWRASEWDASRSIGLHQFAPVARLAKVRLYSLQQGAGADAESAAAIGLRPLSRWTGKIEHAAAAMLELDLVITVDSMVAHLAGALGRPVWLLLQHQADWRWMRARTDSPWYPTMRIFRQPRPGDWAPMVEMLASELEKLSTANR
jgi:hypothetical protein